MRPPYIPLSLLISMLILLCMTSCQKTYPDVRVPLVGQFALIETDTHYTPIGQTSTSHPDTLMVISSMIDPNAIVFNNDSFELAHIDNVKTVFNGPLSDSVPCIDEVIFYQNGDSLYYIAGCQSATVGTVVSLQGHKIR